MAHQSRHSAVMHTHTRAGMAVAATREGLMPISMNATAFHGALAYHDYEGVSLELDERSRLLKDLGDGTAMMLRNHGLLTTGRSVAEAFIRLYRLERACQTQVDAGAAGTISVMGDNVAGKSRSQLDGFGDASTRAIASRLGWTKLANDTTPVAVSPAPEARTTRSLTCQSWASTKGSPLSVGGCFCCLAWRMSRSMARARSGAKKRAVSQ